MAFWFLNFWSLICLFIFGIWAWLIFHHILSLWNVIICHVYILDMILFFMITNICINDLACRYKEIIIFSITLLLIGGEFLYSCSYMLNLLLHPYHVQENTKSTHSWYDLNVSSQFLSLFWECHILREASLYAIDLSRGSYLCLV